MSDWDTSGLYKGSWSFHNPVRLVFGCGSLDSLPGFLLDRRVLILTTSGFTRRGLTERVKGLAGSSIVEIIDTIEPNPELSYLEETARELNKIRPEAIVALGGGSVIDTAKVFSAVLSKAEEQFSLRAHLENSGDELVGTGIPVIAAPTTAGTGAEVTPFATVWDSVSRRKHSLSGPQLFPEVALLDPQLTVSLPRDQTIITGLDAISHALEAIWNRNATPVTTMYATEALKIAVPTLQLLVDDLDNVEYRTDMLRASLLAGMAISNTRTALAHSMSYPLTINYGVPHGLACSFALPAILRFNAEVDDGRLYELAHSLGFDSVEELHLHVKKLLDSLSVGSTLAKYVSSYNQLRNYVQDMLTPSRSGNNMTRAACGDLMSILRESI